MKKTKKEMYAEIRKAVESNAEMVAFIDHEMEILSHKSKRSGKPTATQVANEKIRNTIFDNMVVGKSYRISDLIKEMPGCQELSTSKMSALIRPLISTGAVVRTTEKQKAYFTKVNE